MGFEWNERLIISLIIDYLHFPTRPRSSFILSLLSLNLICYLTSIPHTESVETHDSKFHSQNRIVCSSTPVRIEPNTARSEIRKSNKFRSRYESKTSWNSFHGLTDDKSGGSSVCQGIHITKLQRNFKWKFRKLSRKLRLSKLQSGGR